MARRFPRSIVRIAAAIVVGITSASAHADLQFVSPPGTSPAAAEITLRFLPGARPDYNQTHNQTRTCRTLADNPLDAVTPETLRQVEGFAETCVQARQMDPAAFEKIRQLVSRQTALYAAMSDFIRQVSQLGSEAAAQQNADVQELIARHAQIAKEAEALGVIGWADEPVPGLESAEATLKTLQSTSANRACESAYDRAGMPAAWRSAQYLFDASQLDRLVDLVCLAAQSGATVRYLPKGMIGREGFAIEKKQTRVRIYPEVERNNDGTLLLVPSRVTINGESFEITNRNSIHQLAGVLLTMLQTR